MDIRLLLYLMSCILMKVVLSDLISIVFLLGKTKEMRVRFPLLYYKLEKKLINQYLLFNSSLPILCNMLIPYIQGKPILVCMIIFLWC